MAELACGIIGLPNVGKSTLFNALTASGADASNYPFCTIDPNVGVVELFDPRLDFLAKLASSKKVVYAAVRFVDIAGLVKGASVGEGLGNKFLANIRETQAVVHVVRCFESENVAHVAGAVRPIDDIETVNMELQLADLQSIEKICEKEEKRSKGEKGLKGLIDCLKRAKEHLNDNKPLRTLELSEEEEAWLKPYCFLTAKKVIYAANVSEDELPHMENKFVRTVREYAEAEGGLVIPMCAKLEAEISALSVEEQLEYLSSLGLQESGLQRLARASFDLLGLIVFITSGEMETKAWVVKRGSSAYDAAGKIHSDIQRGFIRAEVINFEEMKQYKSRQMAREHGKLRFEGKDYIVRDGDVVLFMHA